MLNASSRLIRTQPPSFFLSSSSPSFPSQIGRKITRRISQAAAATPEDVDNMDNTKNNPKTKEEDDEKRDAMVDSFGVDYATRSIEEGFGGVYGGKQSLDGNPPVVVGINKNEEYDDKNRGSEVKEESQSRHQS